MIVKEIFESSIYFGLVFTLIVYAIGCFLNNKFKLAIFNPLLISSSLSILFVAFFKIDIDKYISSTKILSYFLTPATVCLAIPLYEQFQKLKENWLAVIGGILMGTLAHLTMIFVCCLVFKVGHTEYISLLPKSITTAIGIALSEQYKGITGITIGGICIAGITGNSFCELVLKVFRIKEPIAKGIAIGTSSHALGTSKAIQLGEIEGAMSGLSVAVCGILTVILASFYVKLI